MVLIKIKINLIKPQHYLDFIVVYNFDIVKNMEIDKTCLIGTNILLQNQKLLSIELESTDGVKYKYLIRKFMKKHSKVKVKDMIIKHIKNADNHHYYLVLLTNINKHLRKIKNIISSLDEFNWRSFYETYTPSCEKELEKKYIYNDLANTDINTFLDSNINITEIYDLMGDII